MFTGLFKTDIFLFHNFFIITVQFRFIGDSPHLRDPYEDKYIELRYVFVLSHFVVRKPIIAFDLSKIVRPIKDSSTYQR